MLIKIGAFDCTEVWDGVFYKALSDYPDITNWELRNILDFIDYEQENGRDCKIECDNKEIIDRIQKAIKNPAEYKHTPPPSLITECTACPYRKGCETSFVCHTTPVENALRILKSGKLLSAVKARNLPVEQLMSENRNAAHDPADFFDYIMFSWGNCQAGDRLVMERKLNRFPNEKDLSTDFTPGVRFYFRYNDLIKHPFAVTDGFLPLKIKDELKLSEWVYAIIIPTIHSSVLEEVIPTQLESKVIYVENDCKDIWDWSEKVYSIIENIQGEPMDLTIKKLTTDDGRDIYEMLQEMPSNENGFANPVNGRTFDEYKEWLKKSDKSSRQEGIVDGYKVPETTFWLYEDNNPVGFGKIRHFMTDALLENGGNVGYAIRPTARDRGLGTRLLSLLIAESKKIGVDRLLLTIRNHNKKSISMALANGGKIEKITEEIHYIWIEP